MGRHLLADDVLLLLLDEERVELVELGLEEPHEIRLLGRHRRRRGRGVRLPGVVAAGPLGRPLGPVIPGADELEALLEVLVGQELVTPLRQRLHDLPAQALAELHPRRRPVAGKKGDFRRARVRVGVDGLHDCTDCAGGDRRGGGRTAG